jgi:hypothetical protein
LRQHPQASPESAHTLALSLFSVRWSGNTRRARSSTPQEASIIIIIILRHSPSLSLYSVTAATSASAVAARDSCCASTRSADDVDASPESATRTNTREPPSPPPPSSLPPSLLPPAPADAFAALAVACAARAWSSSACSEFGGRCNSPYNASDGVLDVCRRVALHPDRV